jgi:tetratricopeptide (TPR) repeat protein
MPVLETLQTAPTSESDANQKPSVWMKIRRFFQKIAAYNETISGYESASNASITDPATAHMHWGISLAEKGDLQEAIEKFQQAATINPKQAEIFCNWGVALAKQKQLIEASVQLRKAVDLEPDRAAYQVLLGATLVEQGFMDEGASHYREAILLKPNHTEPWLNWAIALARSNQFSAAIEKLEMVVLKQATHSQAYYLWGAILAEQHQYEAAKIKFLDCLKFQTNHAEATYLLALCYNRLGEFEAGLDCSNKALALHPEKAECYLTKGDCLANLTRFDEAVEYYDLALALNPKLPDVYLSLGQVFCQQDKRDDAYTYFKQAEQLNPQLPALQRVWGLSLLECQRNEEALERLVRACNGKASDGFAATSLGLTIAQLRLGKLEEAHNTAVEALSQFPTHVGLWHAKGCLAVKQSGLTEAQHWFKEALKLQPDFIQSQLNLAICQLQEGDTAEVVRKLRALYRTKQATSALVVTYYGLALMASGDLQEAELKFKQALALDAGYTKAMAGLVMLYVQKEIEVDALQQFMIQIEDNQLGCVPACWLWAKAIVNAYLSQKLGTETVAQAGRLQWEALQQAETWLKPISFEACLSITPWRLWLLEP